MRIKCPSCETAGRLPPDRLPESGANIRCPSCRFVFFVGGPDALNILAGDSGMNSKSLPTARATVSLPRELTEQVRALAEEARLLAEQTAAGQTDGEQQPANEDADTSVPSDAPAAPAAEAEAPEPDAPGSDAHDANAPGSDAPQTHDAADAVADDEPPTHSSTDALDRLAALAAAHEDDEDEPASAALSETFGATPAPRAVVEQPWRIRADGEMVYDFMDTSGAIRWLSARGSLDGLECSADNGKTWQVLTESGAFQHVQAGGLRSRNTTTLSMRAPDLSADSPASVSAPRPVATMPVSQDTARAAKSNEAEPKARKKKEIDTDVSEISGRKFVLAFLLLVSLGVAYFYFKPAVEHPYGMELPQSPAGQRMTWVMNTISSNTSLTEAHLAEQFTPDTIQRATPERLFDALLYFREFSHSYKVLRFLEPPTDYRIVSLLEAPNGHRGILLIETEPEPPYKMRGMHFRNAQ